MLAFAAPETVERTLGYFETRFGVSREAFLPYALFESGGAVWLVSASPELEALSELRLETAGVALLRRKTRGWKPTTTGLRIIGRHATRNVIELDAGSAERFLARETIAGSYTTDGGFVIVRCGEEVLGCGLVSARGLESQIPASLALGAEEVRGEEA